MKEEEEEKNEGTCHAVLAMDFYTRVLVYLAVRYE